jgi:hypothetical protein
VVTDHQPCEHLVGRDAVVLREGDDVFGDTVNVAARMSTLAVPGQILMTASTAEGLSPEMRPKTRRLDALAVKVKAQAIDKKKPQWRVMLKIPPKFEFDPAKKYFWKLQTNQGNVVIRMFPDVAPMPRFRSDFARFPSCLPSNPLQVVLPWLRFQHPVDSIAPFGAGISMPGCSSCPSS